MSPAAATEVGKRPGSPPPERAESKRLLVESEGKKNRPVKGKAGKRKYKAKDIEETSPLGVLQHEIKEMLMENGLGEEQVTNDMKTILNDEEMEKKHHRIESDVEITKLSSNGDGLALLPHPTVPSFKQIALVPFGLPGDVVKIRVFKSHPLYVECDLLEVQQSSRYRDDSLINCRYFGKCSGCQFQEVSYDQQLLFKRKTIENAYKYLALKLTNIDGAIPEIRDTEPSPLQYKYRTKLTPHFNLPYKRPEQYPPPTVGFGAKGKPSWRAGASGGPYSVLDIEECPIGTDIVNQGLANERRKFQVDYMKYKKGATFLLREDTNMVKKDAEYTVGPGSTDVNGQVSQFEQASPTGDKVVKTCVTDSRQIVSEYVNGLKFQFSAGEFFQNNNSILPAVTNYVKHNLSIPNSQPGEPNYLVDAYCGSGLFSITCSENVSRVIGVEISADSVKFAQINAKLNDIENATFIVGKAERIFENIDTPNHRTSVILDPPRKGCDHVFLNQLSDYKPARIVYISCNVHSQARDIDWFITNTANGNLYKIESIKGFDFFPQTHHVESVAVLALK